MTEGAQAPGSHDLPLEQLWITEVWNEFLYDELEPGVLYVSAWLWARTWRKWIPKDKRRRWLLRMDRELQGGGGAFQVTDEFWQWQYRLGVEHFGDPIDFGGLHG